MGTDCPDVIWGSAGGVDLDIQRIDVSGDLGETTPSTHVTVTIDTYLTRRKVDVDTKVHVGAFDGERTIGFDRALEDQLVITADQFLGLPAPRRRRSKVGKDIAVDCGDNVAIRPDSCRVHLHYLDDCEYLGNKQFQTHRLGGAGTYCLNGQLPGVSPTRRDELSDERRAEHARK